MIKETLDNNPKLLKWECPKVSQVGQNPIFLLELGPIPFLGLDLIDPWSSLVIN